MCSRHFVAPPRRVVFFITLFSIHVLDQILIFIHLFRTWSLSEMVHEELDTVIDLYPSSFKKQAIL
jgi:hypothetical protein